MVSCVSGNEMRQPRGLGERRGLAAAAGALRSGPSTRYVASSIATTLSISVAITSFAPKRARKMPGIAPPGTAGERTREQHHRHGEVAPADSCAPSQPAARPPMISCPSAPMLNRPARNAIAIPSAGKSKFVVCTSVSASSDRVPNAPSKSAPKPTIGETCASSIAIEPTPKTSTSATPRSRTARVRNAAVTRAPP